MKLNIFARPTYETSNMNTNWFLLFSRLERIESLSLHYGSDKTGLCPHNLILSLILALEGGTMVLTLLRTLLVTSCLLATSQASVINQVTLIILQ